MCEWGNHSKCFVNIPAEDSYTGQARWKYVGIDSCIAPIVNALNSSGILTRGSCCGHEKADSGILLQDGREILIISAEKSHARGCNET